MHVREDHRKIREELRDLLPRSKDLSEKMLETSLIDRDSYRRIFAKDHLLVQSEKIQDRFKTMISRGPSAKQKEVHRNLMKDIYHHNLQFFDFHKKKVVNLKKNANGCKNFIEVLDRQGNSKREKNEKERMKALKENDMDAYIELINTTKNSRLLQILKQTDDFLRLIGAKVLVQKGESDNRTEQEEENDELTGEKIAESLRVASRAYYQVTHTIQEEVKIQPKGIEGGALKTYQLQGLQWLVSLYNNNLHGILADEMGLGKTIQTIALFQYLIENKDVNGPFLVVVPLSTLSNWMMEFKKWAPKIKVVIYKGPPAHRKHIAGNVLAPRKFNVLLTTYEYIMKDKLQLTKIDWCHIVVDEGHRMKNSKSKFAQVLGLQYNSQHRLLLTGTPLQNNLAELWSLLNFLLPKIFHSQDDFEKWFNQPFAKMSNEKQVSLNEEETLLVINRLHQVLRPFLLRRVKKEVESQLPDKVEYVIKVELSSWQRRLYKDIQEKSCYGQNSTWKAKNLNNTVMQLRKVCNHPYLFLHYNQIPVSDEIWRCSGKFEILDRMLEKFIQTKHKVLIFCQMTQLMDIMQLYFDYRNFDYLRLDGATKPDDRDHRVHLFNMPESHYSIFLLSTRAGGLGINLQAADTVIIYDSDWNPHMDLQAQDRAHRIGQKKEVRVYRLVTNTRIEETILTKAAYKKDVEAKVIEAGLFNSKATEYDRRERLRNLLKNDEDDDSVKDENEFLNDQQLNEIIARNQEEFELFEKIDADRAFVEEYNARLLGDDELPDWLCLQGPSDDLEYGRGCRDRKRVTFLEEQSESSESFQKFILSDDDPDEFAVAGDGFKIIIGKKKNFE
jgi:ATP-dependent helicase STH1/SNF2